LDIGARPFYQNPGVFDVSGSFRNIKKPFRHDKKPPFYVNEPLAYIKKPFRHVMESFRHITKPFCHVTKSCPYVTKPFRHITKPFPYVTKSFRHVTKPFFYIAKSFLHITKRLPAITKRPSDLKSLPGAGSILPGAEEMSLPCMVRGFPAVASIESSSCHPHSQKTLPKLTMRMRKKGQIPNFLLSVCRPRLLLVVTG
jgi:hypothetical protein